MSYSDLIVKSLMLIPLLVVALWMGIPLIYILLGWLLWGGYCVKKVLARMERDSVLEEFNERSNKRQGTHWSDNMREIRTDNRRDRERQATIDAAREDANMDEVYQKIGNKLGDSTEEDETMDEKYVKFNADQVEYLQHLIKLNLESYQKLTTTNEDDEEVNTRMFLTKSELQFRNDLSPYLAANVDIKIKLTERQVEYLSRLIGDDEWDDSDVVGILTEEEVAWREELKSMICDEE